MTAVTTPIAGRLTVHYPASVVLQHWFVVVGSRFERRRHNEKKDCGDILKGQDRYCRECDRTTLLPTARNDSRYDRG
jgi:hypothetical protein